MPAMGATRLATPRMIMGAIPEPRAIVESRASAGADRCAPVPALSDHAAAPG